MPRETKASRQARLRCILEVLPATYPNAHCELHYTSPLELLIATILSAQSTDKQVNVVTQSLFKKYRAAGDYASVPIGDLEDDLRRIGLFRNKARNIQACCRQLVARYGGNVPETMGELVELEGVGRKTANVVLGNAFGKAEGVVVDTHVARLSGRLKLSGETQPEKIERDLMAQVPREHWTLFSHWIIWHGRRRCHARKPDCASCELRELCPSRS